MSSNKNLKHIRYTVLVAVATFFIALALGAYSNAVISKLDAWYLAFFLLLIIIFIGIVFDVIGVAVAAANPAPLNAGASRKLRGAQQALVLLKNADKVANICNDVVGDISGTLSGGVGAALALSMPAVFKDSLSWLPAAFMSAAVAALTVGGKAAMKRIAIAKANSILLFAGRVIAFFQSILSRLGLRRKNNQKNRQKKRQEKA